MIYMSLVKMSWADSTQSEVLLTFLRTWCEVEFATVFH